MDLTTAINRRARRTPEQMIADMQAKIAAIKSQAEQPTAAAPQSVPDRKVVRARAATPSVWAKQRRADLQTRPTTSNAARPSENEVTNSLQAEIRSCVDSFAEDIVELINRSTLDAVQRAFGEAAKTRHDFLIGGDCHDVGEAFQIFSCKGHSCCAPDWSCFR